MERQKKIILEDFRVFRFEGEDQSVSSSVNVYRKDYYSLLYLRRGWRSGGKETQNNAQVYCFQPDFPFHGEKILKSGSGIICHFQPSFMPQKIQSNIDIFLLFFADRPNGFALNIAEDSQLGNLFVKIYEETDSRYYYKREMIQNYLLQVFHLLLKQKGLA